MHFLGHPASKNVPNNTIQNWFFPKLSVMFALKVLQKTQRITAQGNFEKNYKNIWLWK